MSRIHILLIAAGGVGVAVLVIVLLARRVEQPILTLQGAVVMQNTDPAKQLPVTDTDVSVIGSEGVSAKSDDSGGFRMALPGQIRPGQPLLLRFVHPDYETLDMRAAADGKLYIAHLAPVHRPAVRAKGGSEVTIANVVIRYSTNAANNVNVGSAVKTLEIENKANVPCQGRSPCSPDGRWKATLGTATMDAGPGNEYHNARASCIAGPCPFTRMEENNFSHDSRTLHVSVLNWSETTTFLIEAEVYRPTVTSIVRQSYPLIFERALTFTLPGSAEGVSLEVLVNDSPIVFPLGPALILSWATCKEVVNKQDSSRVYRCELKPGYQFSEKSGGA